MIQVDGGCFPMLAIFQKMRFWNVGNFFSTGPTRAHAAPNLAALSGLPARWIPSEAISSSWRILFWLVAQFRSFLLPLNPPQKRDSLSIFKAAKIPVMLRKEV